MSSKPCLACLDLAVKPRAGTQTGVKFTSIRQVFDKASQGCAECRLLQSSFAATLREDIVQSAIGDSGKWSQYDSRVVCDYDKDGVKKKVEFRFECPAWKLRVELYGVEGMPNRNDLTYNIPAKIFQGSVSTTATAKKWIKDCFTNHDVCRSAEPAQLPKRILAIDQNEYFVYLCEPAEGTIAHYACQSYCWGTSHNVKTELSNYKQHKLGVRITSLPKTFRDTIAFARSLSLKYLWIDSMCIVQDDIDDWRIEAAKMAEYYSNAYVTLAATMSTDSDGGLFQKNDDVTLSDGSQTWLARSYKHLQGAHAENATLFGRGWIYQERLLSPRVLHFTSTELAFECNKHNICECGQDMPDQGWYVKQEYLNGPDWKRYKPTLTDVWHRVVEAYSKLQLTQGSDKLPALAGLATQMETRRHGPAYLAGLRSDSLLADLLWYAVNPSNIPPWMQSWRAPSWSWASTTGPLRYGDYPRLDIKYAKVIEAVCECRIPSTADSKGNVEAGTKANLTYIHFTVGTNIHALFRTTAGELVSGYIVLSAPVFPGEIHRPLLSGLYCHVDKPTPMNGVFHADYDIWEDNMPVQIMRIGRDPHGLGREYYLVLRKTDNGEEDFERVGMFTAFSTAGQFGGIEWDLAEVKTLKII